MKVTVEAEPYLTRQRLQYRRGPGGAELDVPVANLRTATGAPITQNPVRISDLGGGEIWNAADTLGSVGGVVQVRAALLPDTDLETRLSLYPTNGAGAFYGNSVRVGRECTDSTAMFAHGDFDGDGKADLICRHPDNKLYIYSGDGLGGFKSSAAMGTLNLANADSLFSPGDFDGDAKADIIFRNTVDTHLYLVKGNGAGGYLTGSTDPIGWYWGSASLIFSPGDFSGDGKPDVLYRGADTHLYMVRGNGSGSWLTGASEAVGWYWGDMDQLFSPGDFNGDGKADVVYRRTSDTHLYMIRGNGSGSWIDGVSVQIGWYWGTTSKILSPGDFDGDGKVDVLCLNVTDATLLTDWVTVTVDPDADGAASTSVGPGSLNLLTGDYTLSSTDVDDLGLSVGRVASSRKPDDGWLPQGERLTVNQQQVGTDLTGFGSDGTGTLVRSTARGQSSSTDSLEITPVGANDDTYATLGCTYAMCNGMVAGKRYRLKGWIYVPAATGLTGGHGSRGVRMVGFYADASGYHEVVSPMAAWTDGWQELTVDLALPTGTTIAFFRLYNGMPGGSGKKVYYDNLSLREVVAPFGPSWRGGVADSVAGNDFTALEVPETDLVEVKTAAGGSVTFAKSGAGQYFPAPGAEMFTLVAVDATTYDLKDISGTNVRFTKPAGAASFTVSSTWTTEANSTSTYVYDTADNRTLVSRVASPAEPGVTGCAVAAPTVPGRGCEVLEYVYATTTTATASTLGDMKDQVSTVRLWTWDPVAQVESAVDVVRYAYDDQRRLREVWDPRVSTPLKTV